MNKIINIWLTTFLCFNLIALERVKLDLTNHPIYSAYPGLYLNISKKSLEAGILEESPVEIWAKLNGFVKELLESNINNEEEKESLLEEGEKYLEKLGPGIITGAADDDPSGIATYSQTGAQYGTSLLWLAAWTFPLMAMIQEMCARISLVTGRGLAANIKHSYSKKVLY